MELEICVPHNLEEQENFDALKSYLDSMFFC